MKNYTDHFNTGHKSTKEKVAKAPQTEKVPGTDQVLNNAGGFVFKVGSFGQLKRFLILGSEGGSYYVGERKLTQENAKNVIACIKENGLAVVSEIVRVSTEGRAPKNDPAIFALALAVTFGDEATKKAGYAAISRVCRTGTHIFQFAETVQNLRGWSRGLRGGVGKFYTNRDDEKLALQLIKYRQREGWTHRDVLRLAHVKPANESQAQLLRWAVGKVEKGQIQNPLVAGFEQLQALGTSDIPASIKLIQSMNMPWEALPTEILGNKDVWSALLPGMPLMAMVRNLGKMTSIGLLGELNDATKLVFNKLNDKEQIKNSRLHPLFILNALKTYETGHGFKGSLSWTPVKKVMEALDDAYYASFGTIESTGKNFSLGIDVSASMTSYNINGMNLSANVASAAMAMVTARVEPWSFIGAFDHGLRDLGITAKSSLNEVIKKTAGINGGGTDCSLPIVQATKQKMEVDTFVIYTDNETYFGNIHPFQALKEYRQKMGRPAKLVVAGMVSNGFTIADPSDAGMLDIVGFDTGSPDVIAAFTRGDLVQ